MHAVGIMPESTRLREICRTTLTSKIATILVSNLLLPSRMVSDKEFEGKCKSLSLVTNMKHE
jgi:hypothetical protein